MFNSLNLFDLKSFFFVFFKIDFIFETHFQEILVKQTHPMGLQYVNIWSFRVFSPLCHVCLDAALTNMAITNHVERRNHSSLKLTMETLSQLIAWDWKINNTKVVQWKLFSGCTWCSNTYICGCERRDLCRCRIRGILEGAKTRARSLKLMAIP